MAEKRGRFLDVRVWKHGILVRLLSLVGIGASITREGDLSFLFSLWRVNIGVTLGYHDDKK
jgi:hypothetical protein